MTPEQIRELEQILETCNSPGWKLILNDVDHKVDAIKEGFTQFGITEQLWNYGQGRISVYRELLTLEAVLDEALKQAKEDSLDNEQADSV